MEEQNNPPDSLDDPRDYPMVPIEPISMENSPQLEELVRVNRQMQNVMSEILTIPLEVIVTTASTGDGILNVNTHPASSNAPLHVTGTSIPSGSFTINMSAPWTPEEVARVFDSLRVPPPPVAQGHDEDERGFQIGRPKENFIEVVSRIAEECYPGMWSIESIRELLEDGTNRHLLIHFPEITITNRDNASRTLKDLYVALGIGDEVVGYTLFGHRSNLTLAEAHTHYRHSHLSGNIASGFSAFCLGDTSFRTNITELHTSKWSENPIDYEMKLQGFLFQLESYLSWESLEGVPFQAIRNIRLPDDGAEQGILDTEKAFAFRRFLAYARRRRWIPPMSFDFERTQVNLVLDDEVERILALCTPKHQYKAGEEFYTSASTIVNANLKVFRDSFKKFRFKGRQIELELEAPQLIVREDEGQKRKYAHRKIVNYVEEEFRKLYRGAWFQGELPTAAERRGLIDFKRQNINQLSFSAASTVLMSAD